MQETFARYGLVPMIQHSLIHFTCTIHMIKLLELPTEIWLYNRPINLERVNNIADSLITKQQPLSIFLQCIFNKKTNCLEIIDGQHRYNAIKYVQTRLTNDGTNNWFYSSILPIEIKIYQPEDKEVKEWFCEINNCIPTPELYLDPKIEKKKAIEEILNKFYLQYNTHFTGAISPYIPNTNKENFTELICYIYDTADSSLEIKQYIYTIIDNINNLIEDKVTNDDPKKFNKKINQKSMEKCYKTGLFLFLASKEKLYQMIAEYKL